MRLWALVALAGTLLSNGNAVTQQPARDPSPVRSTASGVSISGRVVDAIGDRPLRRVLVRLTSAALPKARSTRTDDRGRYEFTNLPATGSFTLSAAKPQYLRLEYGQRRPFEAGRPIATQGKNLSSIDFQLPRAAAITGTVLDASEGVDQMWVFAYRRGFVDGRPVLRSVRTTVTNDAGQFRLSGLAPGDYYVVARERATPTDLTDEPMGYATTYYPGTTFERDAQPIRLEVGQEIVNLDVPVVLSRTAALRGQVVDINGKPAPFATRVMLLDSTASGTAGNISGGAVVQAGGQFLIRGVRPGVYQLMVRHPEMGEALLPIEVTGADMTGLTLVMGAGATVTGRIVSSSGNQLPFSAAAVELSARPMVDPLHVSGNARGAIRPDWFVQWAGLTGPRLFRTIRIPDGWWLKAVMRGDQDIIDTPIILSNGDAVSDLSIVVDDHPTAIDGDVRDRGDAPVGDCTVIVYSNDADRWGTESRFVRAVRPDSQNRFQVIGLPPGEYLAAAVEYVEQGQWLDPRFLENLRNVAAKISLGAGTTTTVHLLLAPVAGQRVP